MLRYRTGISRDATGNLLPQAFVHAYLPGTQTYIAAFSDELGATPLQLPLKSDAQGNYAFFTPEPIIDLRYVFPGSPARNVYNVPVQARQTPFVVSVDSFGAKGDGLTDDRAAIQAAVSAAAAIGPGSIVRFTPGRTYHIVGEVLVQETLIVDLTGAVIQHEATAYGKGLFRFRAPQQFAITWPYDIEANSREWSEQDPPYTQGDYLLFTTDYDWIDRQYKYDNTHYGLAFLVERVNPGDQQTPTTVTLSDFFVQGMKASDGIQLRSFKRISPVIRGGEIRTDDSQASGGVEPEPAVSYCIRFCHCVYPRIEGTRLTGLEFKHSAYLRFEHCFAPTAEGMDLRAVNVVRGSEDGVYGVHFAGATSHGQLLNSDRHGLRNMADATWADLEDAEGAVQLSRICGVFWSTAKGCRAFDPMSSGYGPHGTGRYFDVVDCRTFNSIRAGFRTRVSYTRFINCRAESADSESYAFDIGGGVQEGTGPQNEGSAYGGQNPLVGCEMVNCTQVGFQGGLFRICNMSSLTVRDCSLDLPQRMDGSEPYYWFFGHFDFSNPRLWQTGWRYLPGDWVRDAWAGSSSWNYKIYECKLAHTATTPPHELWPINDYWVEIDGTEDRPSPLRGKLVIRDCRFIHQNSGWLNNGLHPDWGFKGPFVFPELIQLDSVEMSPGGVDHHTLFIWAFRVLLHDCIARLHGSDQPDYALNLILPGGTILADPPIPLPTLRIDGAIVAGEVRIQSSQLEGSIAAWHIDAGAAGEYTLQGDNLESTSLQRVLGSLEVAGSTSIAEGLSCGGQVGIAGDVSIDAGLLVEGNVVAEGSISSQSRMKAAQGIAFGNAENPSGNPGLPQKFIKAYDMDGNEIGYLVTYWLE